MHNQAIVSAISDAILMVDKELKIVFANAFVENVFGYAAEELTGRSISMLIEEFVQPDAKLFEKRKNSDGPVELSGLHKNKSSFPIEISIGESILDGKPIYACIIRNISDRKESENQIREVTSLLSTLIQTMHLGVLVEDCKGNIILSNSTFCNLFDIHTHPDDLSGQKCSSIASQTINLIRNPDQFISIITSTLENKKLRLGDEIELTNGQTLERDYMPIFRGKNYEGHLWIYKNITHRKQTERYIQQLALLTQECPNPILRIGENLGVLDTNSAGMDLLEKVDLKVRLLEPLGEIVNDCLHKGEIIEKEFYAASIQKYFKITFVPVPSGNHVNLYGADITELKQTQKDLIQAKQIAEESSMAKQNFLARMTHELRTPMNGVLGLTNILLCQQDSKTNKEHLRSIKSSGEHLLLLINDILDLSKMEAGKLELQKVCFSPREVLRTLNNSMKVLAEQKNINLRISLDIGIPDAVIGDPVRLSQILLNLVSNAIKFTDQGYVEVRCQTKAISDAHTVMRFEIEDTGIGIAPESIDNIFESFDQGNNMISSNYGGTGLGLSIVKQLVEMQSGSVTVNSKVGKGSVFAVDIPYPLTNEVIQYNAIENSWDKFEPFEDVKILLVEDNPINQIVATKTLETWSIKVDLAIHGKEALHKLTSERYDMVIMDILMPVMDGMEASSRIRSSSDSFKNIPILAMTASILRSSEDSLLSVGINDHISKPFDPEILHYKIQQLLPHKNKLKVEKINLKDKDPLSTQKISMGYFDPKLLRQACLNREEVENEILDLVPKAIPPILQDMKQALQLPDHKTFRDSVHKLAGSLGLLGAQELANDARIAEKKSNFIHETSVKEEAILLIQNIEVMLNELAEYYNISI